MYRRIIFIILFIVVTCYISISINVYDFSIPNCINVEVKGNVEKEGIYKLPLGSTINDLFQQIDIKDDSDLSKLSNLQVLKNNQIIVVEKKSDMKLISINSASVSELIELPGIGESTANKIINYRNTYGSFIKLEDLKNVEGIGDKKYERIKQYICL